jgi:hypothetical protein
LADGLFACTTTFQVGFRSFLTATGATWPRYPDGSVGGLGTKAQSQFFFWRSFSIPRLTSIPLGQSTGLCKINSGTGLGPNYFASTNPLAHL